MKETQDDPTGGIFGAFQNSWFGELLAAHWMLEVAAALFAVMCGFLLLGALLRWIRAGFFLTYGIILPLLFFAMTSVILVLNAG